MNLSFLIVPGRCRRPASLGLDNLPRQEIFCFVGSAHLHTRPGPFQRFGSCTTSSHVTTNLVTLDLGGTAPKLVTIDSSRPLIAKAANRN